MLRWLFRVRTVNVKVTQNAPCSEDTLCVCARDRESDNPYDPEVLEVFEAAQYSVPTSARYSNIGPDISTP